MLVIILLITPRTFLREGTIVLGRRGFTNGPTGSDAGIGIGGRPWLQKVAALTVAISLTIATADTFKIAEHQYNQGFMDALKLQDSVANGTELKVIRIISDTFLWLAQAQTLIRLFPRQREKIIIKWTAFALITLDVLFSTLNNFVYDGETRPRSFVDAIPALSYLFQLALSLLYCAWVIYYSITKKRFAFYHTQMRNICLVAVLSFLAVIIPIVFFVLDISSPTLASWGDYVSWVGAAAASVVVWEWVERIEALERNDKEDGVLGREVFDGDEMLDITPETDFTPPHRSKKGKGKDTDNDGGGRATGSYGISWAAVSGTTGRHRPPANHDLEDGTRQTNSTARGHRKPTNGLHHPPLWPRPPPAVATPVSRTDTASAESTIYAVRYHPISEATPPAREYGRPSEVQRHHSMDLITPQPGHPISQDSDEPERLESIEQMEDGEDHLRPEQRRAPWQSLRKNQPFKRRVHEPPHEISGYAVRQEVSHGPSKRWDVRARIEGFAASQVEKIRERRSRSISTAAALPLTIIPAPPRRRNLVETLEALGEEDMNNSQRHEYVSEESLPSSPHHTAQRHRMSDPSAPEFVARQSMSQHRAASFVVAPQQALSTGEGSSEEHRHSPLSSQIGPSPTQGPSSSRISNGLPVMSIPAPPRRGGLDDN
jgi:hypothetical protein